MTDQGLPTDRRSVLKAAAASAALLAPGAALAQTRRDSDRAAIGAAVDADYPDAIRRLQQWIALPTIAAEGLNVPEGAAHMARLATEAGFTGVRTVPTGGVPAVFGTLDAGAARTVGIYFMYDVKQFDPAEWASPPLEGRFGLTPCSSSKLSRASRCFGASTATFFCFLAGAAADHSRVLLAALQGALLIARATGDHEAFDRTALLLIKDLTRKG